MEDKEKVVDKSGEGGIITDLLKQVGFSAKERPKGA